jgi:heme exporter protein A
LKRKAIIRAVISPRGRGPMLEAQDLAAQRGDARLFAGLSFALEPGSALLVRGPNGSGKTTLLRILASVVHAVAGQVRWCGRPVRTFDPHLRANVLFVAHAPALKDELTTEENLASLASLHGAAAGRDSVREALAAWGLTRQRMLPARVLSQGQRRRASLARLQMASRPLWLLDEPANGLDDAGMATLAEVMTAHLAATHHDLPLAVGASRSLRLA